MHIVLAALGTIVTILILLNRLSENGIDVGWLNPFAWKRRRDWAKKYHTNPIYTITSPMEVTGLLMIALAKSEGDMSAEQKQEIKKKFREVFHLDEDTSSALMTSSIFILKDNVELVKNMSKLLKPSIESFSQEQASSAVDLLIHIANFDSPATQFQQEIIESFKLSFKNQLNLSEEWG